ncbi:cytochrome c biogenesis heme-transporting ATPase CcmA [Paraglaciecola aestuariivivens]
MAVLSINNLSVSKSDRLLFENLNFTVEPGQLLYLKGQNGAGKTSLLRVLAGLSMPDTGSVTFNQSLVSQNPSDYYHELVYFGHKLGLNQNLTALENLGYWAEQQQLAVSKAQLFEVLAQLNLVGLEDLPINHLSAGQQRRVALARFWLKPQAKLWILDEPFTALDTQGVSLLTQHIQRFLQQAGAVIMTSHQALAMDYPTQELELEYRLV